MYLSPQRLKGAVTPLSIIVILRILWQVFQLPGLWGTETRFFHGCLSQGSNSNQEWLALLSHIHSSNESPSVQNSPPCGTFLEGWAILIKRNHRHSENFCQLPSVLREHKTHLSKVLWENSCLITKKQLCIATVTNFWKMLKESVNFKPVTAATASPSDFNIMVSPSGPLSVTSFLW